ncbi:Protein kinase [Gracilaria domingensis]|nr:Protein kinase [Gracilaria domingensis]
MFPRLQNLLHELLPHVRGHGVQNIEIVAPDFVLNFQKTRNLKPNIENMFPGVPIIKPQEITVLKRLAQRQLKVSVRGLKKICLQKMVSLHDEISFSKYALMLMTIGYHPHVTQLCDVVEEKTDQVVGILTVFNSGRTLDKVKSATDQQKERWITQIKRAIQHIHARGARCGSMKPSDVMVDDDMNTCIIDFGERCMPSWLDEDTCEVMEVDDNCCKNVFDFIDGLSN